MPIYEYLCPDCNRVYSFLARSSAAAERQPVCPRCGGADLRKQISRFAFVRGRGAGRREETRDEQDLGGGPADDQRIEREMAQIMRDAEGMEENDPRQLGRLMRRMAALSGEGLDAQMEEAVRRLEAGEDPERIEEDLGDEMDDSPSGFGGTPSRDEGLYEL